ncbi:prolyl oligopeptidase family serine peptidase, partial [Patescibacteria group bacterium]|nr:prolyl oligopeptidase family serine peptidase [Patescibacteria group bacterium]
GSGTHRAATYFAERGYITLAPDFLGFGSSSEESEDILLNRFRRPETVLYLLASLGKVNEALVEAGLEVQLDLTRVGFWAHSNGGQITLSVLEITGRFLPATLWAPVTKPFPDSVLQYASEMDDDGRLVIERIAAFEKDHDCEDYSVASRWSWLKAPLQVHQGKADTIVVEADTQVAVVALQEAGVEVGYWVYPGADHNLKQSWDEAIERDVFFFERWL